MKPDYNKVTFDEFNANVRRLAAQDGIDNLINIPGVWEIVSEHYNNDALELWARENGVDPYEEEEEEE